jgi:hypothetical protein
VVPSAAAPYQHVGFNCMLMPAYLYCPKSARNRQ